MSMLWMVSMVRSMCSANAMQRRGYLRELNERVVARAASAMSGTPPHGICLLRATWGRVGSVSDKPQQTYILHTVGIAIVLVIALVVFLRSKWG